jgi:hypothetical protein
MALRLVYVPAALALVVATWIEQGPLWAFGVVVGGLGLGLLVEHRAKRRGLGAAEHGDEQISR